MTKTYQIHAWCVRPFIVSLDPVEAATPEEAIAIARRQPEKLLNTAEECNISYPWEEFAAYDEHGVEVLRVIDDAARLRNAAPTVLEALQELLADIESLADEFEICHEIIHSSYGKAAYRAIALAEGSLRQGRSLGA